MITPTERPFSSMLKKSKANARFFEWQTESLASAANNAQIEGNDVTSFTAITPTTRWGNYTQISTKNFVISDTEEIVDKAGRKSEMAYQIGLKGKALRLDVETSLFENKIANGGNSTTARVTAGLGAWVKTNVDMANDGANPSYTTLPNNLRTDGTQRTFTETMLRTVMRTAYNNGGRPKMVSLGSFNKALVSETFDGIATATLNVSEGAITVIGAVDVYISDFGKLQIAPNLNQRARDAWFLDPSGLSLLWLRPIAMKELAKTGDAEKRMLIGEYCLKVNHEKQHGLVADLNVA
jgi:hypothetical protein